MILSKNGSFFAIDLEVVAVAGAKKLTRADLLASSALFSLSPECHVAALKTTELIKDTTAFLLMSSCVSISNI